jgi:hypothetical protein
MLMNQDHSAHCAGCDAVSINYYHLNLYDNAKNLS